MGTWLVVHRCGPGNHLLHNLTSLGGANSTSNGTFRVTYQGPALPAGTVKEGTLCTVHPRLGLRNGTGVAGGLTYLVTNSSNILTANLTVHGGATESIVSGCRR